MINKYILHSMAREHDWHRVCLTSDEDEPDSEPADDPNDRDFAPSLLIRVRRPRANKVAAPAQPFQAAPPNPVRAASGSAAANAIAPPDPSFAHDLASARQYLLANMSAQGHKQPWIRYDLVVVLMIWDDGCTPMRDVDDGGGVDDLG